MQDNPDDTQAVTNIAYGVFQPPTFDDIQYESPAVHVHHTASRAKNSLHRLNAGDCDMVKNVSYAAPSIS